MRKQLMTGLAIAAIVSYSGIDGFWVANIIAVSDAAELGYASQVSNELGIKITATLQQIPEDATTWDFEMSLETHTHALSNGMEDSSVLIADGKKYKPLGWEGSPPGGHHRKGVLHFKAITPKPVSVELQIRLIGDPTPRSLKWRLK
jgi:hypothetical protein